MHLVQIFLPLNDNSGIRISREAFAQIRDELMDRFGGLTAYSRAPADGLWKPSENETEERDDIVIYEVMVHALDRAWWNRFRQKLEVIFRQQSILVRASEITLL